MGLIILSCKEDWLDAKPDQSLVVPSKLTDYRALLDNTNVFGRYSPGMGDGATDQSYVTDQIFLSFDNMSRNIYIWADGDISDGHVSSDWYVAYREIMNANVVLDGLEKLPIEEMQLKEKNTLRGEALFHRARVFYELAQVFCNPYDPSTANTDLGLPLKNTPDVNENPQRSSLEDTYRKILSELGEAYSLLPESSMYKTRPNKHAVTALLARIYLSIED